MTTPTKPIFNVYIPGASSPGFLGEVVIVAAVSRVAGGRLYGESYTMIERATPRFQSKVIIYNETAAPAGSVALNFDFMLASALDVARGLVASAVNSKFEAGQNWEPYRTLYSFDAVEPAHLAHLWAWDRWHKELGIIRDTSRCDALISWLTMVSGLPVVKVEDR